MRGERNLASGSGSVDEELGLGGGALKDVPEDAEPGQLTPSHGGQITTGLEFDMPVASSAGTQISPAPAPLAAAPPPQQQSSSKRSRPLSMPPQSANSAAATAHLGHSQRRSETHGSSRTSTDGGPRKSSSRVVGEYNLGKTLGAGSMGKVKLAYHITTGERLAVKIVPRPSTSGAVSAGTTPEAHAKQVAKDASKEIRSVREASLSMLLHHPYICGMRDFIVQPHNYFMVMEYVNGGQLLDYIISHGRLRERVARKFARQISSALEYCHRNNIVHRDLKIENILISANGNIKLIDFGLSNLYNPQAHLSTFCGSLYFAAPELLNAKVYTGPEVDVWSFGVVLYVLVCGKVPFDDQSMPALHAKIKRGVVEYPVWLSADCKALLGRILITNPVTRATMHEVTHHPWMVRGFSGAQSVHFPKRTPLRVDELDPAVIRGMTGFEFGSEKDIMRKLTQVLESDAYQRILRRGHDSSSTMVNLTGGEESPNKKTRRLSGFNFYAKKFFPIGRSNSTVGIGNGSLPHASSSSSIFDPSSIANTLDIDATRGFHPLISIYFLVRERMERERFYGHPMFASSKMSLEEAEAEKERQRALEPITIPETLHAHNGVEAVPGAKLASPGSALLPSPRSKAPEDALSALPSIVPSSPRTIGHSALPGAPIRAPPASTHRRSQSLSQRPGTNTPWVVRGPAATPGELGERVEQPEPPRTAGPVISTFDERSDIPAPPHVELPPRSHTASPGAAANGHDYANVGRGATLMRRFGSMLDGRAERRRASLVIPRTSVDDRGDRDESEYERSLSTSKSMPLTKPFASASSPHKRAATVMESEKRGTRHERRGSIGPGLGLFAANTIGRRWRPDRAEEKSGDEGRHEHDETTDDEQLEQSDRDFKPLFMKGLFSVQTTSTKQPAVLHADLRRVLDRMQIQHREIKGGFECMHAPSIDIASVVPPSPLHQQQTSSNGHSREPSSAQKLTKKSSKLSFVKLGRSDRGDGDSIRSSRTPTTTALDTEKDLPPRPSVSVSGSSFLNIGAIASNGPASPNGGGAEDDAMSQRSQTLNGGSAAISRSASPTKSRFVPPIPRDFAGTPTLQDPAHAPVIQPPTFEGTSNPLSVRFEVHVVKVPLLPLHGIQFRRVGGDAWQYQMLARRVLTELKL